MNLNSSLVYTTDDVCPSNLKYWKYWDEIKQKYPDLKIIAFTIANYQGKENVAESKEFEEWYERVKNWVTVQPHGLNHEELQLGWRDYETQKRDIQKSIEILKPYLPRKVVYRFPGFRTLCFSEKILKEVGCDGVAYQTRIKYFDGHFELPFNTHCSDKYTNPITKWRNYL